MGRMGMVMMIRSMGGGGGGKPHLATAGGKDNSKLKDAIDESYKIVQDAVSS